jgi:hypothetical protein
MCNAESIPDLVDNHMKGNISVEKDDVASANGAKKKKATSDDDEEEKEQKLVKPLYLERVKPGASRAKEEVMHSARVGLHPTKVCKAMLSLEAYLSGCINARFTILFCLQILPLLCQTKQDTQRKELNDSSATS